MDGWMIDSDYAQRRPMYAMQSTALAYPCELSLLGVRDHSSNLQTDMHLHKPYYVFAHQFIA